MLGMILLTWKTQERTWSGIFEANDHHYSKLRPELSVGALNFRCISWLEEKGVSQQCFRTGTHSVIKIKGASQKIGSQG